MGRRELWARETGLVAVTAVPGCCHFYMQSCWHVKANDAACTGHTITLLSTVDSWTLFCQALGMAFFKCSGKTFYRH